MASNVRELMSRAHELNAESVRWEHPFAVIREAPHRDPAAMIAVLPSSAATDPLLVARVCAVHRRLAAAAVPHVLPITAVEHDEHALRLVYRRVEAESLASMLGRGPLPLARTLAILRRLCAALAAAQRLGVDHRALGPASVLLGPHGDAELWIADFGVADLLAFERASGELAWLPITPEQVSGGATATSEDVYLLGCLAHWMIAGRPVFTAEDLATLRRRHAIEDPLALAPSAGRRLPDALVEAVTRALEKDPDDRFADFESFDEMLVRAEIEAGIPEREPSARPVATLAATGTSAHRSPARRATHPLLWTAVGGSMVGLPLAWTLISRDAVEPVQTVVITASVQPEPILPLPPVPGPLPPPSEPGASFEQAQPSMPELDPHAFESATPTAISFESTSSATSDALAIDFEPGDEISIFDADGPSDRPRASSSSSACEQVRRAASVAREAHDWNALLRASSRASCWRSVRSRTKLRIKALMELKRFDDCAAAVGRSDLHDHEVARWGEICERRNAANG